MNVAATFRQKMPPVWAIFYFLTGGSVRTEPGKNVKCRLRRGDGKKSPQYPPHGTKALIRQLHKDHEAGWQLLLAVSSKPAQAKSQRAEALVDAFTLSKNYGSSTTLLFLLLPGTWYALGIADRENTSSQ